MDQGSSHRESWAALRNASSAAQLAVSMLMGPLAPWRDPAPSAEQMREILAALDATTRQINALVIAMAPSAAANETSAANGPVLRGTMGGSSTPVVATPSTPPIVATPGSTPIVATSGPVATPIVATPSAAPSVVASSERSTRRPSSVRRPESVSRPATPPVVAPTQAGLVDVGELLRQVAVDASLEPDLHLEVSAPAGLRCPGDREAMRAILGGLVRDAAAMGPLGAIVEIRAYTELADALGDELEAVIEVRPDARASSGQCFAATPADLAAVLGDGVRLEVHGRGGRPRARLRAAMAAQARILAA